MEKIILDSELGQYATLAIVLILALSKLFDWWNSREDTEQAEEATKQAQEATKQAQEITEQVTFSTLRDLMQFMFDLQKTQNDDAKEHRVDMLREQRKLVAIQTAMQDNISQFSSVARHILNQTKSEIIKSVEDTGKVQELQLKTITETVSTMENRLVQLIKDESVSPIEFETKVNSIEIQLKEIVEQVIDLIDFVKKRNGKRDNQTTNIQSNVKASIP